MAIKVASLKVGSIIRHNKRNKRDRVNTYPPVVVIKLTVEGMNCMALDGRGAGSPEIGVTATVWRFHGENTVQDAHFCTKTEIEKYFSVTGTKGALLDVAMQEGVVRSDKKKVDLAKDNLRKTQVNLKRAKERVEYFCQTPEKAVETLLVRYRRKLPYLPDRYNLD